MVRHTLILALAGTAFLPACTPTPTPGGGAPTTGCALAPDQTANGLAMNCTVTGPLPSALVTPVGSGCNLSTFSLFGQNVNVPLRVIYGENGDDGDARVRMGATINGATHSGSLAKSAGNNCDSTTGPVFAVNTSFSGRHIALIDKGRNPMCVFQSRLDFDPFNQTIQVGIPVDVSGQTRDTVRSQLARRLDFELASAVNRLLNPNANITTGAFVDNSGRCDNDWAPFVGN